MSRPVLLDLFCGAGGAGTGYALAGFHVIGVDIDPQPAYPFNFIQRDVMDFDLDALIEDSGAVAIHASPPCQAYSPLNAYNKLPYPDLVPPTRELLESSGLQYVIENVPQAPLRDPMMLCGSMFGLRVYRHRHFESNAALAQPGHSPHVALCARNGYLPTVERQFMTISGGKHSVAWQRKAADVMGVPWMATVHDVCESIPPAYTAFIGGQLIAALRRGEVAA
jgi:DNA (cytosine-5)-methyltransferase 1